MYKVQNEKLNEYLWRFKEIIFEDLEKYDYEIKNLYGSGFRINPCPYPGCGHNDCCTVKEVDEDENLSLGKCFSCGNKYNFEQLTFQCYEAVNINPFKHLEKILGITISNVSVKESDMDRLSEIMKITAEFCYKQLLVNDNAFNYENNVRNVSEQNLEKFKVGYMANKHELRQNLINNGYNENEIKESKVFTICDGLIIFPYYENSIIKRFNTKNPFMVETRDGNKINGFSIGEKTLYHVPGYRYADEVFLVEGEHDLITCYQNGIENVIATGGAISKNQIEDLRRFKSIYIMTDLDEAGRKYVTQLNEELPEVKLYDVQY